MMLLKQSTTFTRMFLLSATGLTVSVQLSKNGGAFSNPSGGATNLTEVSSRWYKFDGSTTDSGTLGALAYRLHDGASVIDPSTGECQDQVVTELPGQLANNAITDTVLAANCITAVKIADDAITASAIASDTITAAKIDDGAIRDQHFTLPAESAGRPGGVLSILRRLWEWQCNKRRRDRSTGLVTLRNDADNATLETQTQSTEGAIDSISEGA